mmetsp:Transcript_7187/g.29326  ORF Transcript_7187/g.29326 Transcript_7187/m.29326 type:complete len:350 (+) Transcript_7187:491-1540(+)
MLLSTPMTRTRFSPLKCSASRFPCSSALRMCASRTAWCLCCCCSTPSSLSTPGAGVSGIGGLTMTATYTPRLGISLSVCVFSTRSLPGTSGALAAASLRFCSGDFGAASMRGSRRTRMAPPTGTSQPPWPATASSAIPIARRTTARRAARSRPARRSSEVGSSWSTSAGRRPPLTRKPCSLLPSARCANARMAARPVRVSAIAGPYASTVPEAGHRATRVGVPPEPGTPPLRPASSNSARAASICTSASSHANASSRRSRAAPTPALSPSMTASERAPRSALRAAFASLSPARATRTRHTRASDASSLALSPNASHPIQSARLALRSGGRANEPCSERSATSSSYEAAP